MFQNERLSQLTYILLQFLMILIYDLGIELFGDLDMASIQKKRFSGRYEVVLWYTKTDDYKFFLDEVRIDSKYPAKKHYKGPKKGTYSSNPKGKNPEDVWDIPNVKGNHVEKTIHPCQFPIGLIQRLALSMTEPGDLIFDPFSGVASAGATAALLQRRFWGCDTNREYLKIGKSRINKALEGSLPYRPHDKPIFDHTKSKLSTKPSQIDKKQKK